MTLDAFPSRSEFRPNEPTAPYCAGAAVGCSVLTAADLIERYTTVKVPDLTALGKSMGARCRARDGCQHGICGKATWCQLCIFLELDARQLPFAYSHLSWAVIESRIRAGLPVALPGVYGRLARVAKSSYSPTLPAKGRSDSFTGLHSMVVWQAKGPGSPTAIVSDPDFGSPSRPIMPPHSEIPFSTLRSYWQGTGGWSVCYATQRPDAPPQPTPGTTGDVRMVHTKPGPGAKALGTFVLGADHDLIDTADTLRRYPGKSGLTLTVYGDEELRDVNGKPIDIDGSQPPKAGRSRVYTVDHPTFGAMAWALVGDGVFTGA